MSPVSANLRRAHPPRASSSRHAENCRSLVAGGYYHLINRGNDRSVVFHRPTTTGVSCDDRRAQEEIAPAALLAFCLMPNHFHLVVSRPVQRDVSRWMHWLLTTHTHRHHLRYGTSGRVWQGRFKAFPIEQDDHLLTVMRYVERNACARDSSNAPSNGLGAALPGERMDPVAAACPSPRSRSRPTGGHASTPRRPPRNSRPCERPSIGSNRTATNHGWPRPPNAGPAVVETRPRSSPQAARIGDILVFAAARK